MTTIKFELSEEYKRQLKIRTVSEGKTLTSFILETLYAVEPPKKDNTPNVKNRIEEINNILSKHGAEMTKEEREKLKLERQQLKRDMREI